MPKRKVSAPVKKKRIVVSRADSDILNALIRAHLMNPYDPRRLEKAKAKYRELGMSYSGFKTRVMRLKRRLGLQEIAEEKEARRVIEAVAEGKMRRADALKVFLALPQYERLSEKQVSRRLTKRVTQFKIRNRGKGRKT